MTFHHPEDVKSTIRKKFGSVAAFERARGLPPLSVRDILRGKSRGRIARVLARELGVPVSSFDVFKPYVHNRNNSSADEASHRLNAEAQ